LATLFNVLGTKCALETRIKEVFCSEFLDDGKFLVTFEGYDGQEEVSIGMIRLKHKRKRKRSGSRDRGKRSGSRERNRKRRRRRSRDGRDRRSRDRKDGRKDRNRSSRDKGKGGFFETHEGRRSRERKADDFPLELTNENLDKIIQDRESRNAQAIGRNYARIPFGLKRGLSVKQEVSTTRERSPSPVETFRRRRTTKIPKARPKRKVNMEEYQKRMKAIRDKYGNASSSII